MVEGGFESATPLGRAIGAWSMCDASWLVATMLGIAISLIQAVSLARVVVIVVETVSSKQFQWYGCVLIQEG